MDEEERKFKERMDELDRKYPMANMYYDREGKPISGYEYIRLRRDDPEYYRISLTEINGYKVSTVWLGMNHNFSSGPPLIFETMIFGPDGTARDLYCRRYSTEEEAVIGHEEVVVEVSLIESLLANVDDQGNELPSLED